MRIRMLTCIWSFHDLQTLSQRGAFRHPSQDRNYARDEAALPATLRSTADSSPPLRACPLQDKRQQVSLLATLTYLASDDVAHNQRSSNRPHHCVRFDTSVVERQCINAQHKKTVQLRNDAKISFY